MFCCSGCAPLFPVRTVGTDGAVIYIRNTKLYTKHLTKETNIINLVSANRKRRVERM